MNVLNESIEDLVKILGVNIQTGLDHKEVQSRFKRYGYNEIPQKKRSMLGIFFNKFWGPSAWMLELIMVISWFLHRILDFTIISVLLIMNAFISFIEESIAHNALESLKEKLQITVKVLRDGKWLTVGARLLVPGDVINLRSGDFVPADAKIVNGTLEVDQSMITGESLPNDKKSNDIVYSGSVVKKGEAQALIILTGKKTMFGKTIDLVEIASPKPHIEQVISKVTKILSLIVSIIIIIIGVLSYYNNISYLQILPLILVLLLAAVPVTLPAMFTVSMALGARSLLKHNVLVTRLNALEDAATLSILCIDKTGTLTINKLEIVKILAFHGYTKQDILIYGALASKQESLDPIDIAFIKLATQENVSLQSYTIKKFIPFESETKQTEVTLEHLGQTFKIYKGSLEAMAQNFTIPEDKLQALRTYINEFADHGLRTIALAKEQNKTLEFIGLVGLEDQPRPESKTILKNLTDLGIAIKILTGDSLVITKEIAHKLGIKDSGINFSDYKAQFHNKNDAFQIIMNNTLFTEIYPEGKYAIMKVLQSKGKTVGMTGDGINDVPALQQAEVGIAVYNATDAAKKAASIVLTKPGLYNINYLITTGRLVFQRVHTYILNKISRTILKTSFIALAFLIVGFPIITSTQILILMFMTDFIKLSLATDTESISKVPCKWNIPLLSHIASLIGIVMLCETILLLYIGLYYLALDRQSLYTFCFEILFYFEIFSIFIFREKEQFWHSIPSKTFLGFIAADIIISIILTTYGLISFYPLPFYYTLFVIGYALFFSLIINDKIKRRFGRHS